jgi:hypothetical protein
VVGEHPVTSEAAAQAFAVRLKNRELEQKIAEARPALRGAERLLSGLLLEQQKDPAGLTPEQRFSLVQKIAEAQKDRDVKKAQLEVLEGANADPSDPGAFFVRAPLFTPEEVQRRERYRREQGLDPFGQPEWSVLSSDFRENLAGRGVDPSQPLFRIGDIDSGWEVELKIPQKHLYQVMNAYKHLDKDRLDVDLLVRTDPTRTFKGVLYKSKIGGEATPQKDDNNEAEPVVTAYVKIDDRFDAQGQPIPEDKLIPRELLVTGAEVVSKVRCGDAALGYSLFYGVWEFLCEKVLFVF